MNSIIHKLSLSFGFTLWASSIVLCASVVRAQAQWPYAPPTTPMAQRNALNLVVNQVHWFENAIQTAPAYSGGGYGLLVRKFQTVRAQYRALKRSLTPQQLSSGANQLAELDSGLNIIQGAFTNYQLAVANGRSNADTLANTAQVLDEAMRVWVQQLKRVCEQLRVGW